MSAYQLVWFKRDLRVVDHRALATAAQLGPVIPLYVAEPEWWRGKDMSARQWAFVEESLVELRQALAARGQPLVVRVGAVTDVFDDIAKTHPIAGLWSHEETGNGWSYARDRRVALWARERGVAWHEPPQHGVIRKLKNRNGWAKKWDALMGEGVTPPPHALPAIEHLAPGAIPTAKDLGLRDDPCPGRQAGGRMLGEDCLRTFLFQRGEAYRAAMASPIEGFTACSRLSPHLAWGTLSMREVAQATWARQRSLKAAPRGRTGGWRGSMTSFSGRLHWRDHFTQKLEDQPALETKHLHPAYEGVRPTEADPARLGAWANGETGLPFVDACMRSLKATGWLNFRMRAMLMAVSSYHLWLDWRAPGEQLAQLFTDYEPGIHWPQVQMQSGTTGINTVRIYNPVKQGYDQDPDGVFIRRWVPELATVPKVLVHEPWRWDGASTVLGRSYPHPIVDHLAAAKEARQKVWAVRGNKTFRHKANAIQHKHGSRKSGIKMRGQRSTVKETNTERATLV